MLLLLFEIFYSTVRITLRLGWSTTLRVAAELHIENTSHFFVASPGALLCTVPGLLAVILATG